MFIVKHNPNKCRANPPVYFKNINHYRRFHFHAALSYAFSALKSLTVKFWMFLTIQFRSHYGSIMVVYLLSQNCFRNEVVILQTLCDLNCALSNRSCQITKSNFGGFSSEKHWAENANWSIKRVFICYRFLDGFGLVYWFFELNRVWDMHKKLDGCWAHTHMQRIFVKLISVAAVINKQSDTISIFGFTRRLRHYATNAADTRFRNKLIFNTLLVCWAPFHSSNLRLGLE